MTDMQRAQILHQMTRLFDMSEAEQRRYLDQIKDDSIKSNYARIKRGLTAEENYRHFCAAMPWVKNINGIDQQQDASHKLEYQAPDYSLLVEDSNKGRFNIFIDVKSVKGGKESCEIQPKQKHTLMNYARDYDAPLLLAIYWERLGYWTHNVIRQLGGKKSNKITWQDAIINDVSHVIGDYTFFVKGPFYRRTEFFLEPREGSARHAKYGHFSSIFVGTDLGQMEQYSAIESSAIDSMFKTREVECIKTDNGFVVTEIFAEGPMLVKLSNWLVNFIQVWGFEPGEKAGDENVLKTARIHMVNLMQDLGCKPTYSMPATKNKDTDRLYQLAYGGTSVWNEYNL
ncbi:hypothetical protein [Burkholderia stagnalis]|uniref:hypothetical protein n=1 Tax=Burkholderia stagnalis TaxID=1503054 RepID=UPI000AEBEB7C|nr:hypothetical protein [Burkholderia stagnalis]